MVYRNKILSVQFSRSVMPDSLRPHESQHARPPCPSPTPRVYPNPCPLSQWCHPAISSSVVSFFSCPQSLPASESFPMSQLFARGGQSIGVSASASVLPMNTQKLPQMPNFYKYEQLKIIMICKSLFLAVDSYEGFSSYFGQFSRFCSHGLQPNRLLFPWDFPGKSTGVGCHCLLPSLFNNLKNSLYLLLSKSI